MHKATHRSKKRHNKGKAKLNVHYFATTLLNIIQLRDISNTAQMYTAYALANYGHSCTALSGCSPPPQAFFIFMLHKSMHGRN
jgi:hypothetical protein